MKKIMYLCLVSSLFISMICLANATLVINEVDADQVGTDSTEFVELYNTGPSAIDFSTENYQVVLFNGSNDSSYGAYNLTSGTVSVGGYVIIGNQQILDNVTADVEILMPANFLQNGQDGVGLYSGTSFTGTNEGVNLYTANLVDGLVYDTSDADDPGLLAYLVTDGIQVDENGGVSGLTDSVQRYPDGSGSVKSGGAFVVRTATPGAVNVPVELSSFSTE